MLNNIYVINLPFHQDRMELCKQEFAKVGITNYKKQEGVIYNKGVSLKDREMGCKLSHYNIIKEGKKKGLEYITIFEDDCVFQDDFLEKIKVFDDYKGWGLFYLGANTTHNRGNVPVGKYNYIVYAKYCKTTHAYCIHNRIYDFVLTAIEANKTAPIDAIYYGGVQRQFACNCYFPAIVTQRTGYSYITQKQRDYSGWIK